MGVPLPAFYTVECDLVIGHNFTPPRYCPETNAIIILLRCCCTNIIDCNIMPVVVRTIPAFLSECILSNTNCTNELQFPSYATASSAREKSYRNENITKSEKPRQKKRWWKSIHSHIDGKNLSCDIKQQVAGNQRDNRFIVRPGNLEHIHTIHGIIIFLVWPMVRDLFESVHSSKRTDVRSDKHWNFYRYVW